MFILFRSLDHKYPYNVKNIVILKLISVNVGYLKTAKPRTFRYFDNGKYLGLFFVNKVLGS